MCIYGKRLEKKCIFYINSNINDDKNLLKFLKIFIHHSYAQRMYDYTERKITKFNYDGIKDFIDVETIISRVRNIKNELDEDEKFCIESFINFYENKEQDDKF